MIIVVAGVSGTGKSTIGKLLAEQYDLPFFDADDFHSEANVNKMRKNIPLTDEDRWPWLDELANLLSEQETKNGAVLACSGLKESYRQRITSQCKQKVHWVILKGSAAVLKERLNQRQDHYFDPRLLNSQLEAFELPVYGLHVDIGCSLNEVVDRTLLLVNNAIANINNATP